ncbi:epoxyqueuosine reductase [Propionispora vibrioides]|uniref:4Fe-4S ferredoxin-type domain-containing protein n=1 Tax=Propionispora vibrioides TaxID=112903 RepID=A0A1H8W4P2_9FIRM|nr:epoxyqueuosine reductase [Propionispora vibrioides]SEP22599.1 hypothetical protein SAMN04490178_11424 [Propionispora vibrioides]
MQLNDIQSLVYSFVATSPLNCLEELQSLKLYGDPLVGIASAGDPYFDRLKDQGAIGSHHLSPVEWLPGAVSVISYFLPFTEEIRRPNRRLGIAAREWLYGRIEGELFNNTLRRHLTDTFRQAGWQALAPALDERFAVLERRSNWSERHVAFIAGLGTFSLSRSLITQQGSAGRFGSLIVDAYLEPTPRPYERVDEYCTKCGACILRCPPLAISEAGKDNTVCAEYLDRVLARYRPRYGCGKCQTGVPCEEKIPVTSTRRA